MNSMDFLEIPTIIKSKLTVSNFLHSESRDEIIADIYKGLTAKQKYLSSRFFYDDNGSLLFEKITELPEYYPSRTEKAILKAFAPEITDIKEKLDIIELGSGDCSKISILLDAFTKENLNHIRYIPVDVSEAAIMKSADFLSFRFPDLKIHGLLADFMKHITVLPGEVSRLICFFGSTLGNLTYQQAISFLMGIKILMKPGDRFLLGFDMVKDIDIIEAAYNDKQGVTAQFNRNILRVINEYAQTNFDTTLFEHIAFYNKNESRIEMHLMATEDMVVKSEYFPGRIFLKKGETIHTENSHKFTTSDIYNLASIAGLKIENIFTDKNQWFSLVNLLSNTF